MLDKRAGRTDLPTGTVTFLRTDVEGSMALARTVGAGWDAINAAHLELIRAAVEAHGGVCVRTEGDAFFGVFPEAGAAVIRGRLKRQFACGWACTAVRRISPATTTAGST